MIHACTYKNVSDSLRKWIFILHRSTIHTESWRLTNDTCCKSGSGSSGESKHKLTYKPYVPQCYKDHDHKNMGLKRPMSPHLTAYAPTLPSVTSIFQRITGTILTCYAIMLSGGALFLSNGVDTYVSMIQSLDLSWLSRFIIKIILGMPFTFHYFCGIRFCAWNAGKWLNMKEVYSTAHKSLILTGALAALFALL
ncbi:hypothetical protein ACJJTC_000896 [Scirpophaga incertulas]